MINFGQFIYLLNQKYIILVFQYKLFINGEMEYRNTLRVVLHKAQFFGLTNQIYI